VQSHYLLNACWLDAPPLLERCAALPRVPTLLLHARDDRVCLPEGALSLHARIAHSALRWVELAGHDPAHPAMTGAMVAALDRYAGSGDFALAA
jgi:proline iminopeptidase